MKLSIALVVIVLSGCSSSPNYDKATRCGSATPVCLALVAATDAVTISGSSSQKCSDMSGDKKDSVMHKLRLSKNTLMT